MAAIDILVDGSAYGSISLMDRPCATAEATKKAIRELGIEKIAIISGDQNSPVKATAESVRSDEYYTSQKPEEKLGLYYSSNRGDHNGTPVFQFIKVFQ